MAGKNNLQPNGQFSESRRRFLRVSLSGLAGLALGGCGISRSDLAATQTPAAATVVADRSTAIAQAIDAQGTASANIANATQAAILNRVDDLSAQSTAQVAKNNAIIAQQTVDAQSTRNAPAPTATRTATATATATPIPTLSPDQRLENFRHSEKINDTEYRALVDIAYRLINDERWNLTGQELTTRLIKIRKALLDAKLGNLLLLGDNVLRSTDPIFTQGVIPNQQANTWTANYSEAATAYVSFGGGAITDSKNLTMHLPNGVVDFNNNPELVNPGKDLYPYSSQGYTVVFAARPGPDVLPPDVPDQDLNSKIVVKPNAELQYSYVARGAYQVGGSIARSISAPWLAEQILWNTGGGSNCGTNCGETTLILVQEYQDNMDMTRRILTVGHIARIANTDGTVDFKAARGLVTDYNPTGVKQMESYLASKVLPTWPDKNILGTPIPAATPKP